MPGNQFMQRVAALLKSLLRMLSGTSGGSTHQLPSEVQPEEELSSYVYRSDHIRKKDNTIHHSRLMPRRQNKTPYGRLETSVCRTQNLIEARVWEICSDFFDGTAPKPAIGRGVGPASAVFKVALKFDPDGKPYPEHANIIGWHDSTGTPDDELKHFWMDQAQKMAPHFSFRPRQ